MEDVWVLVANTYLQPSEVAALKRAGKTLHATIPEKTLLRAMANYLSNRNRFVALLNLHDTLPLLSDTQAATLASLLIERGAHAHFNVNTHFIRAAYLGKTAFLKVLLHSGAPVKQSHSSWVRTFQCPKTGTTLYSAVVAAAFAGHMDTVTLLLDHFVGTEDKLRQERLHALRYAIDGGQTEIVRFFLDASLDTSWPILTACEEGPTHILLLLLAHMDKLGQTLPANAMWYACSGGSLDKVQILLSRGADIRRCRIFGILDSFPMDVAIHHNHLPVVQLLLDHGASLTNDALKFACHEDAKLLNLLADRINPPPPPSEWQKPMDYFFQSARSSPAVVKLILDLHPEHFTPRLSRYLKLSIRNRSSVAVVEFLISQGARVEELEKEDLVRCGYGEVMDLLVKAGLVIEEDMHKALGAK
ncbi:hypothetical protein HK104_000774 [Borealophlyctis nickersoniae]|nr:hypothetical protein HK104_000774 [Borealophlyctis nickersoniae]